LAWVYLIRNIRSYLYIMRLMPHDTCLEPSLETIPYPQPYLTLPYRNRTSPSNYTSPLLVNGIHLNVNKKFIYTHLFCFQIVQNKMKSHNLKEKLIIISSMYVLSLLLITHRKARCILQHGMRKMCNVYGMWHK
jgi:hypothetical protein